MVENNKPNGNGFTRILKATYCSIKGLKAAYKEESAFRQELLLCFILFPLSFWLATSISHWSILISSLILLLIIELVNSAIEALTDRVSTEHHILSGRAKDMGSAAVTLSLIIVTLVWGSALLERII